MVYLLRHNINGTEYLTFFSHYLKEIARERYNKFGILQLFFLERASWNTTFSMICKYYKTYSTTYAQTLPNELAKRACNNINLDAKGKTL